ncbi:hypothetical protein EJ04DRAFT_352908 [Polyplosphaeria fusca]|uniref:Uncharacterized protein n=1 Tax=Polyplosphaeria fusca TaxID=682080 RepID=A0A9P4QVQ8_9PLEO|nr:hypothetical protein EJ04DRAFT_352908 [Polyplosphaeria fusca]
MVRVARGCGARSKSMGVNKVRHDVWPRRRTQHRALEPGDKRRARTMGWMGLGAERSVGLRRTCSAGRGWATGGWKGRKGWNPGSSASHVSCNPRPIPDRLDSLHIRREQGRNAHRIGGASSFLSLASPPTPPRLVFCTTPRITPSNIHQFPVRMPFVSPHSHPRAKPLARSLTPSFWQRHVCPLRILPIGSALYYG